MKKKHKVSKYCATEHGLLSYFVKTNRHLAWNHTWVVIE